MSKDIASFQSLTEAEKFLIQVYNIEETKTSTRTKILDLIKDLHEQISEITNRLAQN